MVTLFVETWRLQLVDVMPIVPVIVCVPALFTVIVPASWPVHVGCVGMPLGPTAIVYGSDVPFNVPVMVPFNNTVPVGNPIVIGPATDVPVCVRFHVIRPVTPWTAKSPVQRPVRVGCEGCVGVPMVLVSVHADRVRASTPHTAARIRFNTIERNARIVPVLS
jgi:hypothetical protein